MTAPGRLDRTLAVALWLASAAALAAGALRLGRRLDGSCGPPCAAVSSHEGAILVVGAILLAALGALFWRPRGAA